MKKIVFILATAALIISCDKIPEDKFKQAGSNNGTPVDSLDTDTAPAVKRVLLEDYTGQSCGNCPAANEIASAIKTANGDRVVVMEVHAGFFAVPKSNPKYSTDFRCAASTELDNSFGISNVGNPNGMVDRVGYPTTEQVKGKD